jgi:hypothetical protein
MHVVFLSRLLIYLVKNARHSLQTLLRSDCIEHYIKLTLIIRVVKFRAHLTAERDWILNFLSHDLRQGEWLNAEQTTAFLNADVLFIFD